MLNKLKQQKLLLALKSYNKKFLCGNIEELDESGTRLMINTFLTEVLGFAPIEEVKTEYMIRGTYADYVVQLKGVRHFLVEVKALSLQLSDKHLRQAINYGANEGIEWALLTNGKQFDFYKILFEKPIQARRVFSINLCEPSALKNHVELMQYMHKDSVNNKGLDMLWNKTVALDPKNVAGLLFAQPVLNFIKKTLKVKFKSSFTDTEVETSINRIIKDAIQMEEVKPLKLRRPALKKKELSAIDINEPVVFVTEPGIVAQEGEVEIV
jgi:hypothetical protein